MNLVVLNFEKTITLEISKALARSKSAQNFALIQKSNLRCQFRLVEISFIINCLCWWLLGAWVSSICAPSRVFTFAWTSTQIMTTAKTLWRSSWGLFSSFRSCRVGNYIERSTTGNIELTLQLIRCRHFKMIKFPDRIGLIIKIQSMKSSHTFRTPPSK